MKDITIKRLTTFGLVIVIVSLFLGVLSKEVFGATIFSIDGGNQSAVGFGLPASTQTNRVGSNIIFDRDYRICDISFRLRKSGSPTDALVLNVYRENNGNTLETGTPIATSIGLSAQTLISGAFNKFDFNSCFDITTGYYSFVISRTGAGDNYNHYDIVGTDIDVNAFNTSYVFTYSTGWVTKLGDYNILINSDTSSIALTYPINATTTPDFNAWHFSGYLEQNADVRVAINYGTSTSSLQSKDSIDYYSRQTGTIQDTFLLKQTALTSNNTYYAQAELTDITNNTILATSTITEFYVSDGYIDTTVIATTTGTDISKKFVGLWGIISKKAPIGYLTQATDQLRQLKATSTLTFQLENVSEVGTAIFNPLKAGIGYVLWFIFAIWILKRISKLEL